MNNRKLHKKEWVSALKFTFFSIFIGLLVGAIVLAFSGYNPIQAYSIMLSGIFSKPSYISYVVIYATPLILTGLSVAFSFKTGLFNIGAEGQFIIGSLAAALIGGYLNLPAYIHVPVCILGAILAGGLWGAFSGFLKAKFNVNEVISTIMLNWIAFHLNNFVVTRPSIKREGMNVTQFIADTARIEILPKWKNCEAALAFREAHPIINDLLRTPLNAGIIIAIVTAFLIKYLLDRTSLGYSLRVVGDNVNSAEYNGINVKKNIIISMLICGMLAGAAGGLQVLGRTRNVAELAAMESYGFNGISVALIARNSPIGCIFSGLFFAMLTYGGPKIQSALGAPREIINIVIGTIILFVAVPKLLSILKSKFKRTIINTKISKGDE